MAAATPMQNNNMAAGIGVPQAGVAGAPQLPYASASLYVGDLASDVTEALLFEIFNAVGPVASVRVCRDMSTKRSLGYAYVNFHRYEDAEHALDKLNFQVIRDRQCRIMWSQRDPSLRRKQVGNIFVKGLAKSIDNKQLYDTFSVFGNILSSKVASNDRGESRGFGFVQYEAEESAQQAIERVDGKVIAGSKVSVQHFKPRGSRGSSLNTFTNVFVKNLPPGFTVAQLEELLKQFGTITSTAVNEDKKKELSFGFVNFSTPEEAQAAVAKNNEIEVDGRKLFIGRAQAKTERERELREQYDLAARQRLTKIGTTNLYIKNLSDTIDDAQLREMFGKFGDIESAKVMRDENGKSRCFGFVLYTAPEEATKAVTEMSGKMIDRKPLYVSLAQRKEQRQALLQQQLEQRRKFASMGVGQPGMPYMPQPGMPFPFMPGAMPGRGFPQFPQNFPQQRGAGFPQTPVGFMPPGFRPGFQLMPMNGRGMQGASGQGMVPQLNGNVAGPLNQLPGGRGGPRGNTGRNAARPGAGKPGQPIAGYPQGQPGFALGQLPQGGRYNGNVRNQMQSMAPQPMPTVPQDTKELAAALVAVPEEVRKQMIGERLFPVIKAQQPELAGKITGMLLEMDDGELLNLLDSTQALTEKVQEALQVLESAQTEVEQPEVEQQ